MAYSGKKLSIVIDYLTEYIKTNELKEGQRLPTESEMINATGVSRVTLRRALANLQEDKYIVSIQGSGYFVGSGLSTSQSHTVPIILSYDHQNSQILNIVSGAQSYLKSKMCDLEVHVSRRDPEAEKEMLLQLYKQGCRCVILFPVSSEDNNDLYFNLLQSGMNIIFIDRRPKNITCCNSVLSDNMTGGYLATKHLLDLGHRNIAMFGFEPLEHASTLYERHMGFLYALKENGIPIPEKTYFYCNYQLQNNDTDYIFAKENNITAVFAATDYAAVDIATLAYKRGMRVPEDLSIIGFDNLNITTVFAPQISTIDQSFTKLGEAAAEIAYGCFTKKNRGYIQKIIPVKLIPRESTKKRNTSF